MRSAAIFLLFLASTPGYAGLIYGTLTEKGQPIAQQDLKITCSDREFRSRTNSSGSYSIKVPLTGPCWFELVHKGKPAKYRVFSERKPVRYDLDVR